MKTGDSCKVIDRRDGTTLMYGVVHEVHSDNTITVVGDYVPEAFGGYLPPCDGPDRIRLHAKCVELTL